MELCGQLPRCPALLLPRRVYVDQPAPGGGAADAAAAGAADAAGGGGGGGDVRVVYDGGGAELLSYLLERQRLPEAQCRSVMRQLLQALAALHAERWVHRNISAEAIWVEEEPVAPPVLAAAAPAGASATTAKPSQAAETAGSPERPPPPPPSLHPPPVLRSDGTLRRPLTRLRVRLGGLYWAVRQEPAAAWGDDGGGGGAPLLRELVGCAYHLSPEAISGQGYGRPADIWAAGVLLCMMLTGRPPFPGANELEVMTRILLAATDRGGGDGGGGDGRQPRASSESGHASDGGDPRHRSEAGGHEAEPPPAGGDAGAGAAERPSATATPAFGGFGYSVRRRADDPGPETDASPRSPSPSAAAAPPHPSALAEVVVGTVLDGRASAACREALAAMLVADPAARLSAAELLRLPWFAMAGD
ncbi:hypothetical protein GPECTOR_57g505 [Gonium pectorale]|uniref:Protein kinase domain-containing protein n=1 Tax=Gonium pectorale TaxID=33097 RepID=A0A150G6Q4_GONPE|nr:hypothetical protein GPECTOR_57g505 [Gonium pectorale]|eukprot:KXZ45215.1 hypothetical protein GPECTOR_57g505 [Gonium pectorale]